MDTNEIGFLLGIMAPVFPAIAGCCIAIKKKRNGVLWFFVCLLSGLLGLIVVACSKSLDYEKDLGEKAKESDTLGGDNAFSIYHLVRFHSLFGLECSKIVS